MYFAMLLAGNAIVSGDQYTSVVGPTNACKDIMYNFD
jgi:hypothetical protein